MQNVTIQLSEFAVLTLDFWHELAVQLTFAYLGPSPRGTIAYPQDIY
jgi:hypothetical protein